MRSRSWWRPLVIVSGGLPFVGNAPRLVGCASGLVASALLLVGCASTRQIHLPDGSRGRMVSCSGAQHDWGDCMNRAHRICDGKYRIVERYDERTGGALTPGDAGTASWSTTADRKMLVSCSE